MLRFLLYFLRWRPHVYPCKTKEKGGILLAGNVDGTITQWHASSGKLLTKITEEDNQILAIDYTVSGLNFASGGQDLKVCRKKLSLFLISNNLIDPRI